MMEKPPRRNRQPAGRSSSQSAVSLPSENAPGILRQEVHQGTFETRMYASPLMAPDDLERYNTLIPNGAERFLRLLEEEQANRHQKELFRLEAEENRTKRGQYLAAALLTLCIVAALLVVLTNHAYQVAIALVGAPIAAILIAFVTGVVSGRSERVEKARILADALPEEEQP